MEGRDEIEGRYPRLRDLGIFDRIEAFMVLCEPENEARRIGGFTWFIDTPDDVKPVLRFYFTYASGTLALQGVIAHEGPPYF